MRVVTRGPEAHCCCNGSRRISKEAEAQRRSRLLYRKAGILPRLEAALKMIDVLEAELCEQRRRGPTALATVAIGDDGA